MNEKIYLPSLIYSRYSECQRSSSSRMVPRSDTMIKADCTRIDRDHTTKKPIISCKNSYWQVSVVSNNGIWSTAVMIKTVSLKKRWMELMKEKITTATLSYLKNFHFSNLLAALEAGCWKFEKWKVPNETIYSSFWSMEAIDFKNAI